RPLNLLEVPLGTGRVSRGRHALGAVIVNEHRPFSGGTREGVFDQSVARRGRVLDSTPGGVLTLAAQRRARALVPRDGLEALTAIGRQPSAAHCGDLGRRGGAPVVHAHPPAVVGPLVEV